MNFKSDDVFHIERYFALGDYSYEDEVIFVDDKTLKSIERDKFYKVKDIDLSKNFVKFDDDVAFTIEKMPSK